MAERAKKESKASPSTPGDQLEQMAAFNGTAMEISTSAFQAYANSVATLNAEVMSFLTKRLQHDAELGRALGKCGNWGEAIELQQNWARQASEEYLAEASRLMEAASTAARESWQPIYKRANESLEGLQDVDG